MSNGKLGTAIDEFLNAEVTVTMTRGDHFTLCSGWLVTTIGNRDKALTISSIMCSNPKVAEDVLGWITAHGGRVPPTVTEYYKAACKATEDAEKPAIPLDLSNLTPEAIEKMLGGSNTNN